jgi:outer membrane lipoprotein-sorting protein
VLRIRTIVLLGLVSSTAAIPSRLLERCEHYDSGNQSYALFRNTSFSLRLRWPLPSLFQKPASSSQQRSDAIRILAKVRDTYASLNSFQVEGIAVIESESERMHTKMDFRFAGDFDSPAKVRIETKNLVTALLVVSDGRATWVYIPATKTYSKVDLEESQMPTAGKEHARGPEAFMAASASAGLSFDMFQVGIADGVKEASILREEELELEGRKVACYVVRVRYERTKEETEGLPAVKTYWIDRNRLIVLRESWESRGQIEIGTVGGVLSTKQTTTLTKVRLNEPVPDELFVFVPPEGAKEAEPSHVQPLNPTYPP